MKFVPYTERFGPWQDNYPRECEPSFRLEEHIASLRDGNPERWAELQKEWSE